MTRYERYGFSLIGIDVKPRRKNTKIRKNQFKPRYSRWLFPTILALVSLAIVAIGIR
jgi:hypothetical protein